MATHVGRMNQLLTVQTGTETSDGQGGVTVSWATLDQIWGLVEPLTAREAQMASQITGALSTAVSVYFRTDLSVKDRIVLGSRTLEIQAIQDPTARREELRLICTEVLS
jgi:SPP1 family predicted phage head-tail adaptor